MSNRDLPEGVSDFVLEELTQLTDTGGEICAGYKLAGFRDSWDRDGDV